ncbi:MAG: hypothetical protein ACFB14_20915 [Leptolyngbyaceae cyanobacterium]
MRTDLDTVHGWRSGIVHSLALSVKPSHQLSSGISDTYHREIMTLSAPVTKKGWGRSITLSLRPVLLGGAIGG